MQYVIFFQIKETILNGTAGSTFSEEDLKISSLAWIQKCLDKGGTKCDESKYRNREFM